VNVDLTAKTATAVAGQVTNFAVVMGGGGNDTLKGNAAISTILVGNGGNDGQTSGATTSAARGVLIGGSGTDTLSGGAGDDILVAGATTHDTSAEALLSILAEWQSTRNYATRMGNIQGTLSGTRANGGFFLHNTPSDDTLLDDSPFADSLTGNLGQDWFIANLAEDVLTDIVTSGSAAETVSAN
jgi:Ca2+-binding RTX toxin-like protein